MIKEYILIAIAVGFSIYIAIATYPQDERIIDCSIAEISPDYSIQMKESCRKAKTNDSRT